MVDNEQLSGSYNIEEKENIVEKSLLHGGGFSAFGPTENTVAILLEFDASLLSFET